GEINTGLRKYWESVQRFMPNQYQVPAIPGWIWHSFWKIIHEPSTMWIDSADLAMLCAMIGIVALWLRRRTDLALLIAPLPIAMLASMLRQYPFGDRLILWTVPIVTLLIAEGIDQFWGKSGSMRIIVGIVVTLMIAGTS